jgi:hypothetical protein
MAFVLLLCAVFCLPPDRASVLAASSQTTAGGETVVFLPTDAVASGDHQLSRGPAEMQQHGMTDVLNEGVDGEDELSIKRPESVSPAGETSRKAGEISKTVESRRGDPLIPPPDSGLPNLMVNDHILLAQNTISTAADGGGSDSDDSAPSAPANPSGGTSSGSSEVIKLSNLVRIGDDNDYNGNHPDKFKQNRPSGISWTDSFNISNANTVRSAEFKYTVAGSKVANPVYINGKQAGRLCNPGNTAWNVEDCSINITGFIHSGSNEIKIKCAIDESDTDTPYDDVELYNLRIELTR